MNKVNIILHAHQPYIRHLESESFLEEDWFFEALNETYIPFIRLLEKEEALHNEGWKITLCLSPTLLSMMEDVPLRERFKLYMEKHIELGEKEVERTRREEKEAYEMALHYLEETRLNLETYMSYNEDIASAFLKFSNFGFLELVASAATHAYLPLYKDYKGAVSAQITEGIRTHKRIFGQTPHGFWLPDCGYYPELDYILRDNGIEWVQLSPVAPLISPDKTIYGGYKPIELPSGVFGFALDWSLMNLLRSSKTGYPADNNYREFYRDIGYDKPLEYIGPYLHDNLRAFTGFKYYEITGNTDQKQYYSLERANKSLMLNVDNFIAALDKKDQLLKSNGINDGVINLAFDLELFGHRWYEGIDFLREILIRLSSNDSNLKLMSSCDILSQEKNFDSLYIPECSWGLHAGSDIWLDQANSWLYRHSFKAIERMDELIKRFPDQGSLKARFLNQAARELLLAMASDWPCIMHENTTVSYAKKRLENHLESFNVVYSCMCKNTVNTEWLVNAERSYPLFKDIDYRIFE